MTYRNRAACRRQDPERWFPISVRAAQLDAHPIAVCHLCPVQQECLTDALNNGYTDGTWGGLTEWERKSLHANRPSTHHPVEDGQGSETPVGVGHSG